MKNLVKARIPWIDILRGLAIVIMVPANLSPLWGQPHPLWFRIVASYAAPIFIMLSTGMVVLNSNKYDFKYFLHRGLIIIGFAMFTDVFIWKIFPFVTYDVLYLIGFALPVMYLVRHFSTSKLTLIAVAFFILTPLLQHILGYHSEISEINWVDKYWPGSTRLLQAWLIDGWFPVFPWLGVALFGGVFFRLVFANEHFVITKKMLLLSEILLIIGFGLLFSPTNAFNNLLNHGILAEREGWSEIIYPPTIAYLMTALGMVIIFARLSQFLEKSKVGSILSLFGRFSLLIYILHQAISAYVITPILQTYGMTEMTSGYLFASSVTLTLTVIFVLCLSIEQLKKVYSPSSLVLQIMIGK